MERYKLGHLFLTISGCASILILFSVALADLFPKLGVQMPRANMSQKDQRPRISADAWIPNGRAHAPDRPHDRSRCEEIFNIGARGPLPNVSESLLKSIREAKSGGDPWDFDLDAYDQLSSSMPSLLPIRGGIDNSSAILAGKWVVTQSLSIPWLPCRLHVYHPAEVKLCFLRRRREGLSNHVTFVGDSRTRRTFQAVGKLLQKMKVTYHLHDGQRLNWTTYNSETSLYKGHDNQIVTSELVPGFRLRQFFASNFANNSTDKDDDERGSREIFNVLMNLPTEERPALVVINVGSWLLSRSETEPLRGIDDFFVDLLDSADLIHDLARSLTVVLWLSDPYKTPRYSTYAHTNDKLEWITRNLLWKLRDSDVILWDSTLPVAWANVRDCRVVEEDPEGYGHILERQDWLCYDLVHLGFIPLAFRAQVLINYLCNGVEGRKDVCCS